jgi:hypothetical protein
MTALIFLSGMMLGGVIGFMVYAIVRAGDDE